MYIQSASKYLSSNSSNCEYSANFFLTRSSLRSICLFSEVTSETCLPTRSVPTRVVGPRRFVFWNVPSLWQALITCMSCMSCMSITSLFYHTVTVAMALPVINGSATLITPLWVACQPYQRHCHQSKLSKFDKAE